MLPSRRFGPSSPLTPLALILAVTVGPGFANVMIAIAILLVVLGFNALGDCKHDMLDPEVRPR